MFKNRYKKAFTLIEMLVVIGIISILIGVGAVSFGTAQKKARDSKRQSDLKAMQNCLEQYYASGQNQYPTITVDSSGVSALCSAGGQVLKITDPLNSGTNVYSANPAGNGATYTITAPLEVVVGGRINYSVSQLQ